LIQLLWLTLLAGHTGAAAVWWWLMPGGFPSSAPQFWVNQALPPIVTVVLLFALFARGKWSEAILPPILTTIPVFWIAFALSARLTFPESFGSTWYVPFFGGVILAWLSTRHFRLKRRPIWLIPTLAVLAAWAGWSFPHTFQAPEPSTQPEGGTLETIAGATDHKLIKLSREAQLRPEDGRVVIKRDAVVLNVQPMLSFTDRSPDRSWAERAPTTRTLTAKAHDGTRWTLAYKDEDASVLDVTARDGSVQLDARSRIARPIYSHASTFAELTVMGHKKLTVSFSPAPGKRVDVPQAGTPARFAFLDENGLFHLMQAAVQKRAPFTQLAAGKLARKDPLVVTLYDSDKPIFAVTLDDWAQQTSTALSPAAGDGLPVNVIELERGGEPDGAPVLITFSLAATTIGRGTAAVGHAAGVYRDRITVALP
jgi:hypothetical protein